MNLTTSMKRFVHMLLLSAVIALSLTGCGARSADFTHKTYSVDASSITQLMVDARDRAVEVAPSEDDQIHISYAESPTEQWAIEVFDDGTLIVRTQFDKEPSDYVGVKAPQDVRQLRIQVPPRAIAALDIATTNAPISIGAIGSIEDATLDVNGGDIGFDNLEVSHSIQLAAKNGNITGSIVGSYADFSIDCSVKKGSCNLPDHTNGGAKHITLTLNNGDACIDLVQ